MNSSKIYNGLVTPQETKKEKQGTEQVKKEGFAFESGLKIQMRDDWLKHPLTRELVEYLSSCKTEYLENAMSRSLVNDKDLSHMFLVQADTVNSTIQYIKGSKQ